VQLWYILQEACADTPARLGNGYVGPNKDMGILTTIKATARTRTLSWIRKVHPVVFFFSDAMSGYGDREIEEHYGVHLVDPK